MSKTYNTTTHSSLLWDIGTVVAYPYTTAVAFCGRIAVGSPLGSGVGVPLFRGLGPGNIVGHGLAALCGCGTPSLYYRGRIKRYCVNGVESPTSARNRRAWTCVGMVTWSS